METKHRKVESVEERTIPSETCGGTRSRGTDRGRNSDTRTHAHTLKNMCVNLIEKNVRFLTHGQMILGKQRERERETCRRTKRICILLYTLFVYMYI